MAPVSRGSLRSQGAGDPLERETGRGTERGAGHEPFMVLHRSCVIRVCCVLWHRRDRAFGEPEGS